MSNSYIIETVEKPTRYWQRGGAWTPRRALAGEFAEEERARYVLPYGGCWVLVSSSGFEKPSQATHGIKSPTLTPEG